MTFRLRLIVPVLALAGLAGCQATMSAVVPAGQQAYDEIALTPDEASPEAYQVNAGDKLGIEVYGEPELTRASVTVDEAGDIHLPLIGRVDAAGKSQENLAREIEEAYRKGYLRNPRVNVALVEGRPGAIAVEGQVEQPGVYELRQGSTLLAAIAMARSPKRTAKLDQVLVFRTVKGRRMGGRFDLQAIRAGRADDPQVYDGDVVVVGYSALHGAYEDILRAAPLFNLFFWLDNNR